MFSHSYYQDVGAGTGILSLFSYKAGAKKVFAVEASPMASKLKEIVKLNGAENVIEVLHNRVEDVELDEKVDIIVSEWMGFYLVHEAMLDSVLVARDKHLKPDTGIMLPSSASVWVAACSLDYHIAETLKYWDNVYGFKMSPIKEEAMKRTKPEVLVLAKEQLLTEPVCVADFDLMTVTSDDLSSIAKKHFVSVTKKGNSNFHGLAIWFRTPFQCYTDDSWTNNDVVLDTSPDAEPTHWKQTVIMIYTGDDEACAVEENDVIGWSLTLTKVDNPKVQDSQRHYAIQVEVLDPAVEEHPVPCGCQAAKCALIKALLDKEDADLEGCDDEVIDCT